MYETQKSECISITDYNATKLHHDTVFKRQFLWGKLLKAVEMD